MFTLEEVFSKRNQKLAMAHLSTKKEGSGSDGVRLLEWGIQSYSVKKSVDLQTRIKSRFFGLLVAEKGAKMAEKERFFTKKSVEDLEKFVETQKVRKINGLRTFDLKRSTDFFEENVAKKGDLG